MRTIRVTGKGQLKVRPDVTRITLDLNAVCPTYAEALKESSEKTEQLKNLLAQFGFERGDLKTLNFNVDTEYESYKERGAYKERLVGYRYVHRMKVEFPSDNDRLGKILYALMNSPAKPEFHLSFTVSDPEKAKNELLGNAVADAREKAAVLAQAAGIRLLDIQNIEYAWDRIDFEVRPMERMFFAEGAIDANPGFGKLDMDIEPDDITVTDTVTLLWEIG